MKPAPSPQGTVEQFAEVVAHLSAPFAVREAVLREAGLDERAWSQLEHHWTTQLAADGALVDRYVARYAAVRAPVAGPVADEAPQVAEPPILAAPEALAPLALASPAVPPSLVVTRLPLSAMRIDGTLDPEDGAALRAALPFLKGRTAAQALPPSPVRPPADPGRPDATLELGASLPLPAIVPPGKRLHRFDAKTGAPLAVPIWTDTPADPKKLA